MDSEKNDKTMEVYTIPSTDSFPEKKAVTQKKKFWHIDKEMLGFKIHYFLIMGTFATSLPYITILAQKRVGISASGLAVILTIQRVVFFFAKPSIGYITDYFHKLKAMIGILAVITSVFLFALLTVPKYEKATEKEDIRQFDFKSSYYENLNISEIYATEKEGIHEFDSESSYYEILNISEIYMVCKFPKSNRSNPVQCLYIDNNKKKDLLLHSLQYISNFLSIYTENENKDSENTSVTIEYTSDFENNLSAFILAHNFSSCKLCCKQNAKCQVYNYADGKDSMKEISKEKTDFQRYQFWLYALFATICQGSANSLFTLTDTACCEKIQTTGAQFGHQCLWGSVGWGLTCPIGGLLNDYTGDLLASWIFMAFMIFISLFNIAKLEIVNPALSKNLLKDVGVVLSSKEFLAFTFCVVMNGVGIGIIWFYLVLFLTDIGGSRFLCGIVIFVQNFVAGIPFMFFSGWVIKKIGHFNVLIASLMAYCIRFYWYSQLSNPWFVLPVEVLNGFTEGLLYTGVASYAKLSAKPGTEATTQAVLFTAHESIGIGIGCVVAGVGFDSIGGHRTFLYLSIYAGCAMILSIILRLLFSKRKNTINVNPKNTL